MDRYPTTPAEFFAFVPDEAAAERIFARMRWPAGVTCDRCGSKEMTRLSTRPRWQCRICRAQVSLRSGTVLHGTRKPLRDWLYAAWVSSSTRFASSTLAISRQLSHRYETTWVMVHKIRAALAERGWWQLPGPAALGAVVLEPTKRASGDPRPGTPMVIAMAAASTPVLAAENDALRMHTPTRPNQPDAVILEDARVANIEPNADVQIAVERLHSGGLVRAPAPLASIYRSLQLWLRRRFRGVSRRYMANYLAHFTYIENRYAAGHRRFGWVVRRMAWEQWRPRSQMILGTP